MLHLVRRFLAVTAVQTGLGVATGVMAARTLGPSGRGALAAIIVPLGLLPYVLALGLPTFASRTAAAGTDISELIGTEGVMSIAIGVIAIAPCLLLVPTYAAGNHGARLVLVIGLALTPIVLLTNVLAGAGLGLQQWRRVMAQRLIPPVSAVLGYALLIALHAMKPASAGAVVVVGGLLSVMPFLRLARHASRPRFSFRRAREAGRFCGWAWLIQTSQLLNHRLDQLIMVPLVSQTQLGLYAIAVTISTVTNALAPAIQTVIYPKLAAGEAVDLSRAVRQTLAATAAGAIVCGGLAPFAVPLAFGARFGPAIPMLLVLLVGNLPLSGALIISSAYSARSRIALASLSEVAAVVVTVGGLLLVLPAMGGLGAALVSLLAYVVNFVWLLMMARRDFGGRWRDYVILSRADVTGLRARLARLHWPVAMRVRG